MARIPKNEQVIKAVIARTIESVTGITKTPDMIRLKNKSYSYRTSSTGSNIAITEEQLSFYFLLDCTPEYDCSTLETALTSAEDPAFNALQIVSVRESAPLAQYHRYYELRAL